MSSKAKKEKMSSKSFSSLKGKAISLDDDDDDDGRSNSDEKSSWLGTCSFM